MKKHFISANIWFALMSASALGQQRPAPAVPPQPQTATAIMGMPLPLPPAVDVDIREQSNSPVHLAKDDTVKGRPGTPIRVRNDSGSTVAAYVLRVDVEPYGLNQMVIVGPKGLAVGDARVQALSMPNFREGSTKPVVSVDFVQFTDGKTWGEDSLGKGKDVAAYLKGRNEALAKLQEMLVGQDATDVNRSLDVFSSASFAEPNLQPAGRPPRYVDYAARGYEEVVNILLRMPRNSELGKELAGRLEAAKRPGQ